MNVKRFILASAVVFILFEAIDFVVHNIILMKAYMSLQSLWRPDMMDLMWLMLITTAVLSIGFTYIFIKGRENRGVAEGARFGVIMGLFYCGTGIFNQFVIYPVPLSLALQWFVYGMIEFVVAGIAVSLVYRD